MVFTTLWVGSEDGSGWFRMVQAQCSVILEMNTQHNSLYFVHFGHQSPSTYKWFLRWFRVVPKLSGVRLLKHIELLARSEDAAPLASLRPSKSASPAFPEALEFAIRGRSGTAPAFETAAPAKHSIWQSKLRSHVLRELELENDWPAIIQLQVHATGSQCTKNTH